MFINTLKNLFRNKEVEYRDGVCDALLRVVMFDMTPPKHDPHSGEPYDIGVREATEKIEVLKNLPPYPEWANWIAQDETGEWWAYEEEPTIHEGYDAWSDKRSTLRVERLLNPNWKESLTKVNNGS